MLIAFMFEVQQNSSTTAVEKRTLIKLVQWLEHYALSYALTDVSVKLALSTRVWISEYCLNAFYRGNKHGKGK